MVRNEQRFGKWCCLNQKDYEGFAYCTLKRWLWMLLWSALWIGRWIGWWCPKVRSSRIYCYLAPFIPWPLVHVTGKLLGFSTYYALVLYCDASRKNYCTLLYVFSMKLAVLNFLRLKRGINNCNNNIPHTNSLQNTSTSANVIHSVF